MYNQKERTCTLHLCVSCILLFLYKAQLTLHQFLRVSAQQWKQAFIQFTNIQDKQISIFTSQSADLVSLAQRLSDHIG